MAHAPKIELTLFCASSPVRTGSERRGRGAGDAAPAQRLQYALVDFGRRAEAGDLDEQALVAVHRDQRFRLAEVDLLAMTNRVFGVVSAALLESPPAQATHDLILVRDESQNGVERVPVRTQQLVEVAHLVGGTRVAAQ